MATRKDSKRQERRTAKETGCRLHKGSGNLHHKDDMSSDGADGNPRLRIETKITDSDNFRVPISALLKTIVRARGKGQIPVWAIEFQMSGRVYWLTDKDLLGDTEKGGTNVAIVSGQKGITMYDSELAAEGTTPIFNYIGQDLPRLAVYRKGDALGILKQQ